MRLLRHAGIDKDLATIIDEALDPDPARRYADAGALAADLKAFKSGARIAARRGAGRRGVAELAVRRTARADLVRELDGWLAAHKYGR